MCKHDFLLDVCKYCEINYSSYVECHFTTQRLEAIENELLELYVEYEDKWNKLQFLLPNSSVKKITINY